MSRSIWWGGPRGIDGEPLAHNLDVDVCVVGGGIAGMMVAYRLARMGRQVVLLERSRIGSGELSRTSAHLSSVLDEGFVELTRLHGADGARLARESHDVAINLIEQIVEEEH